MAKVNFGQIWGIVQKVTAVVEVIQSKEFDEAVDETVKQGQDVVTEAKETAITAARLGKMILEAFQIPPAQFREVLDRQQQSSRAMLDPFEKDVFDLMGK